MRRFFYVTQDGLVVWNASGQDLAEDIRFPSTDDGFKLFSSYLERVPNFRSLMVVDVIEEEFDVDSIPSVSRSDRKDLIERRLRKRFTRTPYRTGVCLGGRRRASDAFNVVYSAITNHELIDPWLEIIQRHKSPLAGITSVPLMSAELLQELKKPAENAMFISQHQGGRLRLTFMKSGQPISARLSRDLPAAGDEFSAALISEIVQSRKYLERARRLSADDALDVYFIADAEIAKKAFSDGGSANFRAHIIDSKDAARRLGFAGTLRSGHMEVMYLAQCIKKRPRAGYLLRDRVNYSGLLRVRHTVIGAAVTGAIACSIAVGILLSGAFIFRAQSNLIDAQISQIEETFRRENEEFEPLLADSHEMKQAVDSSDYILRNSLPVDWVMRELSRVLDEQPDMHIGRLAWELEAETSPDAASSRQNSNDRSRPVSIPAAAAVVAQVSGEIYPYDGNLRHAFAKIDHLASSLQENTAFTSVAVAEYPINPSPSAAVSGEVRRQGDNQVANFSLTMSLRVADEIN